MVKQREGGIGRVVNEVAKEESVEGGGGAGR